MIQVRFPRLTKDNRSMRIDTSFAGLTTATELELLSGDPDEIARLLPECLAILGQQKGFLAGALHRCVDDNRWLFYAQWETWDDWNASIFSRKWTEGPGAHLWAHIEQGHLRLQPRFYEVMATV